MQDCLGRAPIAWSAPIKCEVILFNWKWHSPKWDLWSLWHVVKFPHLMLLTRNTIKSGDILFSSIKFSISNISKPVNCIHFTSLMWKYRSDGANVFYTIIWWRRESILFISYKFVKPVLAITILVFAISSWNLLDMRQCFSCTQKQKFSWIRQKMRNFPIDPQAL